MGWPSTPLQAPPPLAVHIAVMDEGAKFATLAVVAVPFVFVVYRLGPEEWRGRTVDLLREFRSACGKFLGRAALVVAAVMPVAIVYRAVSSASDPTLAIAAGLAVAALVAAAVVAVRGGGGWRAIGTGYVAFAATYLCVGLAPASVDGVPDLLTTTLLHVTYPEAYVSNLPPPRPGMPSIVAGPPEYVRFQRAGHCLISIALGAAGALFARSIASGAGSSRRADLARPSRAPAGPASPSRT